MACDDDSESLPDVGVGPHSFTSSFRFGAIRHRDTARHCKPAGQWYTDCPRSGWLGIAVVDSRAQPAVIVASLFR
jgi:hypothetical protein